MTPEEDQASRSPLSDLSWWIRVLAFLVIVVALMKYTSLGDVKIDQDQFRCLESSSCQYDAAKNP